MTARRVAVTGFGVISALGRDAAAFRQALEQGRSGIGPHGFDVRFPNAAQVRDYEPAQYFDDKQAGLIDRFAQFAIIAAAEAIAMSGIEFTPALKARTAIVTGTSGGGQSAIDDGFLDLYKNGMPRVNPFTIPRTMSNAAASHIGMKYGITGPAWTVSTACSSSNHAVGQAYWMVRNGEAECALTGGSEAPFSPGFLKAWEAMRVVSPDTCRPFSRDRKGMILGEGGAMLVLEPLEAARARGATVYAEIAGFGMSADAHHITMPSPEGAAAAMRAALADFPLEQIGYINAHGTGTPANDPAETKAIRAVFGAHAGKLAVSSTKSMHGHTLGAAGAIEAVATILALLHGFLPPTANFNEADPECDLDVVPNVSRRAAPVAALSNSFAFGGLNATLLFTGPSLAR